MDDSSIVCKGWLEWKRRKGVTLRYKNYWFVLRRTKPSSKNCQLECYIDNLSVSKKPNEVTKLDLALAVGKRQARDKPWAFEILFSGKKEQYAAHSSDDRDKWIAALKKLKITQVGEAGDEFDVVMIPTEASQKLEWSMRRHDIANHPIAMRVTPTHLTLGKQNDSESVIVSWSFSHLGPVSHSTENTGQGEQGIVTVKVNDTGSHNGTYQFRTQQYKEVTRAVHNKLQTLMMRMGSSSTGNGRKHVESPTRPLTPQPFRRSLSPPNQSPDVPPRMPKTPNAKMQETSVRGYATMPRIPSTTPFLPFSVDPGGKNSDEDDSDDMAPKSEVDSDDYIDDSELNPVLAEMAGQPAVCESNEDDESDPYLQLVNDEPASDNPYLQLEGDPNVCPKLKSDPHSKAGNKTDASSYQVMDEEDDEGNSHMYFTLDEQGVQQLESVCPKSPPLRHTSSPQLVLQNSDDNVKLNRQATLAAETATLNMKDPLTRTKSDQSPVQNRSPLPRPPPIPSRVDKPGSPKRLPPRRRATPDTLSRLEERPPPPPLPQRHEKSISVDQFKPSLLTTRHTIATLDKNQPPQLPLRNNTIPRGECRSFNDQFVQSPPPLPPRRDSDIATPPPLPKRSASCCDSFPDFDKPLHTSTASPLGVPPPLPVRRETPTSLEVARRQPQVATEPSASPIFPRGSGAPPPLPDRLNNQPPISHFNYPHRIHRQQKLPDTEVDYFEINDNDSEINSYIEI